MHALSEVLLVNSRIKSGLLWLPILCLASFSFGRDLRLAGIFTDNLVLQRAAPIAVWGWASPGERISVRLGTQTRDTTVASDSSWRVTFSPLSAGGPLRMIVKGNDSLVVNNIMVGDVWLCSGQSNMQMSLKEARDARKEIADARYPNVRMFTVANTVAQEPRTNCPGQWEVCDPSVAGQFSAVGYFFGREVYRKLQIPVGLIHSAWGGTPAESWTSFTTLASDPALKVTVAGVIRTDSAYSLAVKEYRKKVVEYERDPRHKPIFQRDAGNIGHALTWESPRCVDSAWARMNLPCQWEEKGLEIDGAVWFRKMIRIPRTWIGEELTLSLGAIDDFDTTYVNGKPVGAVGEEIPEYWMFRRRYTVPSSLVTGDSLCIAVRVFDHYGGGGMVGPAPVMWVAPRMSTTGRISLTGAWRYQIERALSPDAITGPGAANIPSVPVGPSSPKWPSGLYNAMIYPLAQFPIRGVIWYQGENNLDNPRLYRNLLPAMIADWRRLWGRADLAFGIVQLPNFSKRDSIPRRSAWAELREAQAVTAAADTNNGLAVTIDIGDSSNIHPRNKQDVGKRLALWALAKVYKKNIEYAGPVLDKMLIDSGRVRITFTHADSGLVARGGAVRGFAIAGPDSQFTWAQAKIEGTGVTVWSDAVRQPKAVRYGWADNPACNLFSKAGLPAQPFRTDAWPK